MKVELVVEFVNGTIVVLEEGEIVAAGSPRGVTETLKERFLKALKGEGEEREGEESE